METREGARQDRPQVTELISPMTSQSQVTDLGPGLKPRHCLPTIAGPGPFSGALPRLGQAGPLCDTLEEAYGLVPVQSFRGHN